MDMDVAEKKAKAAAWQREYRKLPEVKAKMKAADKERRKGQLPRVRTDAQREKHAARERELRKYRSKNVATWLASKSPEELARYRKENAARERGRRAAYTEAEKTKTVKKLKAWRQQQTVKGLCIQCVEPHLPHSKLCEYHYFAVAASNTLHTATKEVALALKAKMEAQNWTCPYTGEKLIPGLNTHLDHVLPQSRFPQLATDINNVEWTTASVNMAKGFQTKDEFMAILRTIGAYHPELILKQEEAG